MLSVSLPTRSKMVVAPERDVPVIETEEVDEAAQLYLVVECKVTGLKLRKS